MTHVGHVLLAIVGTCLLAQSTSGFGQSKKGFALSCHGVTKAWTSLGASGPKTTADKSSDEIRIVRRGRELLLQANLSRYQSMDKSTRAFMDKPEEYKITAETGEGLVAIRAYGLGSLHVLTINSSLTYGIWNESGFSFLPPQSQPVNYTVSFTCTREKEAK